VSMQWAAVALLAATYLLAMVRYPELNLVLYFIAGKIGFEPRLALGWGLSANQVLQILFIPCLALAIANRADRRTFPKVTVAVLVTFTLAMTIGLLYTPNVEYGTTKVAAFGLLVLPGILYLGLRVRDFGGLQRVMLLVLAASTAMMLMGLRGIGALQHGMRLAVLGGGANVYARLMGTGLLLLVTFALLLRRNGQRGAARLLLFLLVPGFLVTMYFAGSKGPLLGLAAGFLVLAGLNRFMRRTLLWGAIIGLVLMVAGLRSRSFHDTMQLVTASRLFLNPQEEVSYGSYGSRLDFYIYSAQLIAHSPLIGVGTGGWGAQRRLFEERIYPHNIFVEVASEYGLGILALLGSFLGWLLWKARALARAALEPWQMILASGLIACLVFWLFNVQISGDVIDNRNLWIFAVLVETGARIAVRPGAARVRPADGVL
jgi:O-antigen ligase